MSGEDTATPAVSEEDTATPAAGSPPRVAWAWPGFARGLLYALPGAAVALHDPGAGMALAVGVLPAAVMRMPARRRARFMTVVVGLCTGLPMVLGSLLVQVRWVAVPGVFLLAYASAVVAARRPAGMVLLALSLPMVGAGLSYDDVSQALGITGLIVAGSAYAWLVSLLWPSTAPPPGPPDPPHSAEQARMYGLRLGAAGAAAAGCGLALAPTHPGWPVVAALMVMRPRPQMQRLRSFGRVLSVLAGGAVALLLLRNDAPDWAYAVTAAATLALAAATQGSRWYLTPAYSTVLVLLLLLHAEPDQARARADERLWATIAGVALAYLFGLLLPRILRLPAVSRLLGATGRG
ncbi:FUSC family protein [Streptomyces sp. NPDC093221]|uniref:FUSC family protein n=1 Tax=Streptomyces sp. NPDC093221 TaxID=3366032 RepID=UPI00381C4814